MRGWHRFRPRHAATLLPLRARVSLAFGLVSVVVTGAIAVATWELSSNYMLQQRQDSAVRQATVNARLVEAAVMSHSDALGELLTGLGSEVESAVLLVDDGKWISSGNLVNPQTLPAQLLAMVASGRAATQRLWLGDVPVLAVGLPLTTTAATFVEVFPIRELDRTLRFLSWMLLLGVAVAGVAGGLLGRWASRRALLPLTTLTDAAAAAVAGDLSARLPETDDRDLAPLAAAFNHTAERLQQRVRQDARFAADVSHELRSPLTTMLNAITVLRRRRSQLTGNAQQAVDLLDAELTRFKRTVEDLLEMSLTDADAVPIELEPTDVGELLVEVTRHHGGQVQLPARRVLALVDRRRLERALVNLLVNAEQHGHGLIRVALLDGNGVARIEIDDAGPGVPSADRQRIFERFARGNAGDRGTQDGGAGLGLALVRQHVRRHGGEVWVEDRPGGGARFVVQIAETGARTPGTP